ncbi:MAG: lytic murein transglycosylase [Alphaproteobacteria bacterium]
MHRIFRAFGQRFCLALALTFGPFGAVQATPAPVDPGFQNFLAGVKAEALSQGISTETIDAAFKDVQELRRVVKSDRSQPEVKLTFHRYATRLLTDGNINTGRARYKEHRELLREIEDQYGVQGRFIMAFWGMETRYGAITGDIPVVSAVATLAYDKRRSAFFKEQLMAVLKMLDKGYTDLATLKGSWAGAMGQPQFIPTSYLAYAVDHDGDGKRDIWHSKADTFASIANYLAKHGWDHNQTWGREVQVPTGLRNTFTNMARTEGPGCRAMKRDISVAKSLGAWSEAGVTRIDGRALPNRPTLQANLVMPDGKDGRAFLVYSNYPSILRYNCAHLYALTIGLLSDKIAGFR